MKKSIEEGENTGAKFFTRKMSEAVPRPNRATER